MSETLLLSYRLDGPLTSRDGSHPLQGTPGTLVAGPGDTVLGPHPGAMRFGGTSHLSTELAGGDVPARAWTLRMLVQPAAGTGTELLCRCETVPFALTLTPGDVPGRRGLMAIVTAQAHGGQGINSVRSAGMTVTAGTWYLVDLVYDHDTLGLFVDQQLVAPFGLADGRLAAASAGRLRIGGEANGSARLKGAVAGLQVLAGAPDVLSRRLAAARSAPHWYISRTYTEVDGATLLGPATSGVEWDPVARANRMTFQKGFIMHDARLGAFALDGPLARGYQNLAEAQRAALGPLTSDAVTLARPACRYAHFAGGGLYQSALGTVPVTGRIYRHYVAHGGPTGFAGLPRAGSGPIAGGRQHPFQNTRLFEHTASQQVFALAGPVAEEFTRQGGVARCGLPQSGVMPVYRPAPGATNGGPGVRAGSRADFQNCAVFQQGDGRAYTVWTEFLRLHAQHGGLEGELGFPTGDAVRSGTGFMAVEYQTFERGTIVRLGLYGNQTFVCPAFTLFLERLETRESEGFQGENDPYFHLSVERSRYGEGGEVLYAERFPASGEYGDNTVHLNRTLPLTLPTNDATVAYTLRADVWDADGIGAGDDDPLGDVRYELSLYNAWGQAITDGVITAIDRKATLLFAAKPQFRRENYSFEDWHFFSFRNRSTVPIPWDAYTAAFSDDVDEFLDVDDVVFDPIGSLWPYLFYLGARYVAWDGNCWGFAVETQQAWNGTSVFSPPLSRFQWENAQREINVKHVSQLGKDRLGWHVAQFLLHRTQDPVQVFRDARASAARGSLPLLVLSHDEYILPMSYLHVVLPFRWDDSQVPWVMECYDSNFPGQTNPVKVYPGEERWEIARPPDENGRPRNVVGFKGSGSRLWHVPWSIANNIPAPLPSLGFLVDALVGMGFALLWDLLVPDAITDLLGVNLDVTRAGPGDSHRRPYMIAPVPLFMARPGSAQVWARKASTGSVNYAHDLRLAQGVSASTPWRYALAFGQGELYFSGGGRAGDRLRLRMERVGTTGSRCTVSGSRAGTFRAAYTARTDEAGGQVKMILDGLPLGTAPVQFSWQPGLEGFEVIGPAGSVATLTVTYARNGTRGSKRYRLPLDGSRVRISNAVRGGELLVYPIAALNGVSTGQRVLAPVA